MAGSTLLSADLRARRWKRIVQARNGSPSTCPVTPPALFDMQHSRSLLTPTNPSEGINGLCLWLGACSDFVQLSQISRHSIPATSRVRAPIHVPPSPWATSDHCCCQENPRFHFLKSSKPRMGAGAPGYFPGEAELTGVTNVLLSAFQKCIKTYSCQISLERASYERAACFLKAELGEWRLYRTKHLRSHSQQLLLSSVVHVSRPWVV